MFLLQAAAAAAEGAAAGAHPLAGTAAAWLLLLPMLSPLGLVVNGALALLSV